MRPQESSTRLYFETEWEDRAPFEDERERGIEAAQTRVIVIARPRAGANRGSATLARVHVRMETEVRTGAEPGWRWRPPSASAQAFAEEPASDLATKPNTGPRTFRSGGPSANRRMDDR